MRVIQTGIVAGLLIAASAVAVAAHPHVFAEARLEVAAAPDGTIAELRHVWRFDDIFSSTVLLEFDADGDNALSTAELEEVARTVTASIGEYNYFQTITVGKKAIKAAPVTDMRADMVDNQLLIFFSSKLEEQVSLADNPHVGVFDPTFYTALEFASDADMVLIDAPQACTRKMVVPDPDEAMAQNEEFLTESFYETTDMSDLSQLLATRMEVSCG